MRSFSLLLVLVLAIPAGVRAAPSPQEFLRDSTLSAEALVITDVQPVDSTDAAFPAYRVTARYDGEVPLKYALVGLSLRNSNGAAMGGGAIADTTGVLPGDTFSGIIELAPPTGYDDVACYFRFVRVLPVGGEVEQRLTPGTCAPHLVPPSRHRPIRS